MLEQAKTSISQNADQLFKEDRAVSGNPKGDVTLVEFFDYQCSHCKQMGPVIEGLLKSNKNLRVIYKEFPIFGKTSEVASRAALAAASQGKYEALHQALLKVTKHVDEALVLETAKSVGIDTDKLKKEMDSQAVTDILTANRELAEKLHLMGTPAFVVASTPNGQFKADSTPVFIPGAASAKTLEDTIKKVSS